MAEEPDATSEDCTRSFALGVVLRLVCVILGFGMGFAFLMVALYVRSLDVPFGDRSFDRGVWIKHVGSWAADNPRGEMAYDLRDRLLEERPTYQEVVDLLGQPDWPHQDPPERISYVLGAWREPRLDHDSLDIHFGDDGRVEQVSVVKCKNLVRSLRIRR